MPTEKQYISKINLGGVEYEIKDATARQGGLVFHLATNAANTPEGVTWDNEGTPVTGTLPAWDSTASQPRTGIYLVKSLNGTKDTYDEYVAVSEADPATSSSTSWEKLGDTEINFAEIASHLQATVSKTTDEVLGSGTTFTNASSAVTFTGGTSDQFVKSYPGTTSKLATAQIKGVGNDITFNAVSSDPGSTSVHNIVLGTDTSASKIETETKEATKLVLGTNTTASKATAGTAVNVAKVAASATNVSYIGNSSTNSVLKSASVANEVLTIETVAVVQGSVTGTNGTQSITPYTFEDVDVPVVTSNTPVNIASVKTNTSVTVPVVSSDTAVDVSNPITLASKTAATSAANATTVATGSLDATDATGATVMTGLGTATKASAVTGIGTGTAAAQTITVGTNDKVNAMTDATVTISEKNS